MEAKCLAQPQRRSSPELRLRITASWLHCAQSLEGAGLRYRLLPCDMQSAQLVSLRCVRNFECLLTTVDVISLLHLCFCTGLKVISSFLAPLFMRFGHEVSNKFFDIW